MQRIVAIEFQNERDLPRVLARSGLEKPQRRSVGITARIDRQLKVIEGIIPARIDREAPGRAMLEPLIHGQNHQLACPRQFAMTQQPGDIGLCARVVAAVPAQNLLYAISHVCPPVDS